MLKTNAQLARFGILVALAATAACDITVVSGGGLDPAVEVATRLAGRGGAGGSTGVGGQAGAGGSTGVGGQAGAGGTAPPLGVTGACIVRDEYTDLPVFGAPDVGPGYAKQAIPGVNDPDGLRGACTAAIYAALLAQHCAVGSTSTQQEFVSYFPDGTWAVTGCPSVDDCSFIDCP